MPVTLFQHSDASADLWKRGIASLRSFAAGEAERGDKLGTTVSEALSADMPGGKLVAGKVPAADVRHVPTMSPAVRRIVAEIHKLDPASLDATCPMLDAEGITTVDAMMSRRPNRKLVIEDRASFRCPYCLSADVVRTLRSAAKRDKLDVARDPALRWNRA